MFWNLSPPLCIFIKAVAAPTFYGVASFCSLLAGSFFKKMSLKLT
jgi:hypothetical protein